MANNIVSGRYKDPDKVLEEMQSMKQDEFLNFLSDYAERLALELQEYGELTYSKIVELVCRVFIDGYNYGYLQGCIGFFEEVNALMNEVANEYIMFINAKAKEYKKMYGQDDDDNVGD